MPAGVSAITALANLTLGSSATTVTFSSISGLYKDLKLVVSANTASGSAQILVRLNSDATTGNYLWTYMYGSGSVVYSDAGNPNPTAGGSLYVTQINTATTGNSIVTMDLFDYSATNKHKVALSRGNLASAGTDASSTRWASNSAVTTVMVYLYGGASFAAGSTFALYGVSA
jgi:hypothetical protein